MKDARAWKLLAHHAVHAFPIPHSATLTATTDDKQPQTSYLVDKTTDAVAVAGDGTFLDATSYSGLVKLGKGFAVMSCDPDQDGDMDIYVGNDTVENFLYINDGRGNSEQVSAERGAANGPSGSPMGSMGVALCDFNDDGEFDIWVSNYRNESPALYENFGNALFYNASFSRGMSRFSDYVGWGTAWSDLDHDGDEDLVITHIDAPVAVLRNDSPKHGDWICAELIGTNSNRFAIGATLTLVTDKGNYVRQIVSGGSYLSSNDHRVYWGVPTGTRLVQITVQWPAGRSQVVTEISLNQCLRIVEAGPISKTSR